MHNIGFSAATATLGAQKQKDEQKADAEQPKPSAGVMLRSRNGRGKKQRGRVEDFAPELIVRYLSQREEEGEEHISQLSTPVVQRMETIAMFADISGFTTLTEYLDVGILKTTLPVRAFLGTKLPLCRSKFKKGTALARKNLHFGSTVTLSSWSSISRRPEVTSLSLLETLSSCSGHRGGRLGTK